jgi:Fe-S cluster biogenesis protein NfuA
MFIQTETTPNPNSLKFLFEEDIVTGNTMEFSKTTDCKNSILAKVLLEIDGVEKIFFGRNFISVNKSKYSWEQLKAPILHVISGYLGSGQKAVQFEETRTNLNSIIFNESDQEIVRSINGIILSKIKPAVQQDGGDIEFQEYKDGIVYLNLRGSCAGCPSAGQTLKNGVENLLKNYIPEVKRVEQVS